MSGYKDGYKRGTNLHYRDRHQVDPAAELALGLALGRKCERGEHDEAVAEKTQATYLPGRGQVPPGTWYCRRCGRLLEAATEGGEESR